MPNPREQLLRQRYFAPIVHRVEQAATIVGRTTAAILGQFGENNPFCSVRPSPQTAVDLFAGQWNSELPSPYDKLTGGSATLFADDRIAEAVDQFGGVKDLRVLELGPLEGGHTFMLDRLGVAEVTAIEANKQAFLRCLVAKELLGIPSSHFLCGDFMAYLRDAADSGTHWDLCLASGVLYHQQDPVALLELATQVSDRIYLWTQYYDADVMARRPGLSAKFSSPVETTTAGFHHSLYRRDYGSSALGSLRFPGGLKGWMTWMTKPDILSSLQYFGFEPIGMFDDPDHTNGPALRLTAKRR
jgi:hypothetical protein